MMIWSREFPSLPTLGATSQYNFYSIIPYGILNQLGLHSVNSVLFIAGLGLVSLLIFVAYFSLNILNFKLDILVLVTSPLLTVLLSWLGSYDILTVWLIFLALYANKTRNLALVGILAAWINFEQFALSLVIYSFLLWKQDRAGARKLLVAVAFGVPSYALLKFWLTMNGASGDRSTALLGMVFETEFWSTTFKVLPLIVSSIMSSCGVLIAFWIILARPSKQEIQRVFFCILFVLLLSCLALDQTRVGAILLIPICLHLGRKISQIANPEQILCITFILLAVRISSPSIFVWAGVIHGSGWSNLLLIRG